MKILNDLGLNRNISEHPIKNIVDKWYTYTLTDIKKLLGLDNIPKFLSIFGLVGFCVSVIYLLLCPILFSERWVIAVFQIIMFGCIYYIGVLKQRDKNLGDEYELS